MYVIINIYDLITVSLTLTLTNNTHLAHIKRKHMSRDTQYGTIAGRVNTTNGIHVTRL